VSYWLVALLLTAFGFVTGFSIGAPFLLVGLAMLILGPLRGWPRLFWPPLVGVIAFVVVAVLVVPLSCVASDAGGISHTVCASIAGPTWSGTGLYNPPPEAFDLAFREGLAAALAAAIGVLTWLSLRRRGDRRGTGP